MIDTNSAVQTRDGRKVTILSTEGPGHKPLVGYIEHRIGGYTGTPQIRTWTKEGTYGFNKPSMDIQNVPQDVVTYSYFGQHPSTGIQCYGGEYATKPASTSSDKSHKGIVKITRRGDVIVSLELVG